LARLPIPRSQSPLAALEPPLPPEEGRQQPRFDEGLHRVLSRPARFRYSGFQSRAAARPGALVQAGSRSLRAASLEAEGGVMFRKLLCGAAFLGGILFPAWARAAAIALPGGTLTIPGTSTTGTSFTYSGTLTQNDTIAFTQTGNPCLQTAGTGYCTNGAGVLTVAATVGVTPVGGSSSFSGPAGV